MPARRPFPAYLLVVAVLLVLPVLLRAQQGALPAPPALPQTAPGLPGPPDQTDITPGAIRTAPRIEAAVEGFLRKSPDRIALTLASGKTLILHDFDFNGDAVDTAKLHLKLLAPGVYELTALAYDTGYWHFYVTDSASYYGFGERGDTLDHAHTVVHNLSFDTPGPKGANTGKPVPFYLSTTGYGLWLDTTGDATFDLNATDLDQVAVDFASNRLRLLLFTGAPDAPGRFPAILSAFTNQTQRAILPPYWAFAPWQGAGSDQLQTQDRVLEDVQKTRELGLPASVLVIDSPSATASASNPFDPTHFDDAPGMIKNLHENGFKLVLGERAWLHANVNAKPETKPETNPNALPDSVSPATQPEPSPEYQEAADRGFFVKNANGSPYLAPGAKGPGSPIDFTNPKAKQWWQDRLRLAIRAGADGFEDDDPPGATLPADASIQFADGTDPRLLRNRYAALFHNAVEEVLQNDLKGDGVLLARSATTGANGLGFLWADRSDASFSQSNGLPTVVTAALSAGLSGMPLWIPGPGSPFSQPDALNPALLQRWTEFSAFTPAMQVPANLTPWTLDRNSSSATPALDTYRKFAILHMSLFPYRYAAAQQAALTGTPILRALVLDFADDPHARAIKDEYLFGHDLLVAPIVDENTSRPVYLPAGDWIEPFTGERVSGPQTVIAKAPLDSIPVYARRGAVIPKIPEDVVTLVPEAESGNSHLQTLDRRRVYEILGEAAEGDTKIADFEGRTIVRSGNSLTIAPPPPGKDEPAPPADSKAPETPTTRVILRWRFATPHSASVNGSSAPIKADRNGTPTVEFDLSGATTITWQ